MPFYTKYKVYKKKYKQEKLSGSIGHIPQISVQMANVVELSKQQFEVQTFVFHNFYNQVAPYAVKTSIGGGDCPFVTCPLYNFIYGADYAILAAQYKEFRLVEVKVKFIVNYIISNGIGPVIGCIQGQSVVALNSPVIPYTNIINNVGVMYGLLGFAWTRQCVFGDNIGNLVTSNTLSQSPSYKCKGFSVDVCPTFSTSFIADDQQKCWLMTDQLPDAYANTKAFFNPLLQVTMSLMDTYGYNVGVCCLEEYVIECRSSKL